MPEPTQTDLASIFALFANDKVNKALGGVHKILAGASELTQSIGKTVEETISATAEPVPTSAEPKFSKAAPYPTATIDINGWSHTVPSRCSIVVVGDTVLVDGQKIDVDFSPGKRIVNVKIIDGEIGNIFSLADVTAGDVTGRIEANGDVSCEAVGGNVSSNGDVNCSTVNGNVSANGDMTITGSVGGRVTGNGDVTIGRSV